MTHAKRINPRPAKFVAKRVRANRNRLGEELYVPKSKPRAPMIAAGRLGETTVSSLRAELAEISKYDPAHPPSADQQRHAIQRIRQLERRITGIERAMSMKLPQMSIETTWVIRSW